MTFLCTGVLSRLNAFSGLALQYSLSQQSITIPTNYNQRALNRQCRSDTEHGQWTGQQGFTDRQVWGPIGPTWSEIFTILFFWSGSVQNFPFFLVLSRVGPWFFENIWSWSVFVLGFLNLFGPGPGFLNFFRSWSGTDRFWIPVFVDPCQYSVSLWNVRPIFGELFGQEVIHKRILFIIMSRMFGFLLKSWYKGYYKWLLPKRN